MPVLALCLLLAAALPARAQQSPTDFEVLERYAGTWSPDCAQPASPRLQVGTDALRLQAGGRQLRSGVPITSFSYFGKQAPPAGFDVALLGDGRPVGLSLLAMKDPTGPYLTVDVDPPLRKQFGDAALAGKFRRCP